jgi:hypothetical protein
MMVLVIEGRSQATAPLTLNVNNHGSPKSAYLNLLDLPLWQNG